MAIIDEIIVHHTGGLGNDNFASTKNLSLDHIDNAHRARWPEFVSELGYWVGYAIVIFPNGEWVQTRLIGEEGAHCKGHNKRAVGICLVGNFNIGVDSPTLAQTVTLQRIQGWLVSGDLSNLKVKYGTVVNCSLNRIYSHRACSPAGYTDCYGSALSNDWARALSCIPDSYPIVTSSVANLSYVSRLMLLLYRLKDAISKKEFGHMDDRDDVGLL